MKDFDILRASTTFLNLVIPSVTVLQPHCDLGKELPDNVFSNLFIRLSTHFYNLCEIPFLTVFHDDVYLLVVLVDYTIIVANDMWMIELFEYIDLSDQLLFLFITHLGVVHLFPYHYLPIAFSLNLANLSERPYGLSHI